MTTINYNERSWAIDVISEINQWVNNKNLLIKRAGGENTINDGEILFPDVLLYEDSSAGVILQGWELKMPDTLINDEELINNAYLKAKKLKLTSFLVWNVNQASLYKLSDRDSEYGENYCLIKSWTSDFICSRENVKLNEKVWKKLLYSILNDLNHIFISKKILPTKTIDEITGGTISEILLNNYQSVSNFVKEECSVDIKLNDVINIWWNTAQREYDRNADKFDCLAKLILISWLNKFLFANLLKKYQQIAYMIDDVCKDISIQDAISIIDKISNECDFKNIFQNQIAEHCLPDTTWKVLLNFNSFLVDNRLEELDNQVIHAILRNAVNNSKRKFYGQYPTPYNLALFLSTLVIEDKNKLVFDPCCGTGTIISAANDLKIKFIGFEDSINSLWASDKFNFPLQLATLSLTNPEYMGNLIHIFNSDVIDLFVGMDITFQNPFNGIPEVISLPKMDYIISNLPFVQQKDIKKYNPHIADIINSKIIKLTNNDKLSLSGKSDLYAYIPFALWNILSDDGKMGIIISNSWLATDSGKQFYNILNYFFEIKYIITSGKGKWFKDVDVVTNILILNKRKNLNNGINLNEQVSYITLYDDIYDDDFYNNIDLICSQIRTNSISKRFSSVTYSKSEENDLINMGLSFNALFSNVKWLLNLKNKLIKTNSIFDIKRGERRGWDKLFFPENHNIEKEYIKKVIKNSKEVNSYLIDKGVSDAFCCEKSIEELKELNHYGALKWIKKFENQKNNNGIPLPIVLDKSDCYWYTMKENTIANVGISINPDKRIFFFRLKEKCFVNQRLIRLVPKNDAVNIKLCVALLNSILGLFFIESLGFGRGLGVLDLNASNLNKNLFMLDYKLLSKENIDKILLRYDFLEKRNVFDLKEELSREDRKLFDMEVLSSFGIENYYQDIYNSLIKIYNRRKTVE